MSQLDHSAAPVLGADRIRTIDMIRGVALLGILLMNIPGFGLHWSSFVTLLRGPQDNPAFWAFKLMMIFPEGTMRGLFSMLFGAGMVLFMRNKQSGPGETPVAELYFRRLLWLTVFGLFNAYILLWNGDILFFYSFAGMLLFAFRDLKPVQLLLLAALCMGITMLKTNDQFRGMKKDRVGYLAAKKADKEKRKRTAEEERAFAAWQGIEQNAFSSDSIANKEDIAKMRGSYGTVFTYMIPVNAGQQPHYVYHNNWDSLTMMFLGMALLALGYFNNKCSTQTYLLGLLVGYGLGFLVSYFHFKVIYGSGLNLGVMVDRFRVHPQLLYDVKRVLISTGHASAVILLYRLRVFPWLLRALGNVGQMAFTNYLMQSAICSFYFDGFGLGMFERLQFHQLYYVVLAVWIFQLIASSVWLQYFRFGPFEWLWRSLTYWKRQPMLRERPKLEPALG